MATSSADPLAQDGDPEEILRYLHGVPPPKGPQAPSPPVVPFPAQAVAEPTHPNLQGRTSRPPPFQFADPPPALHMLQTARAIGSIVMTRLLLLLVLLCAGGLWALTVYDPQPYRIVASAIFSAMVLWPLCWVVSRRG